MIKIANKIFYIILFIIIASGCDGTYSYPASIEGARATQAAADQNVRAIAAQSTEQAAVATGIAGATRQAMSARAEATAAEATVQTIATSASLNVQATQIALIGIGTRQAIGDNATATAVSALAQFDQQQLRQEVIRQETERRAEAQAATIEYVIGWVRAIGWAFIALGAAALLGMLARRLWLISRPFQIGVQGGNPIMAFPRNTYEVHTPRLTITNPEPLALPAPRQLALPNVDGILDGHVMLLGTTGDGKTQALRELVDQRAAVSPVVVLDPHYFPGAWGKARVISDMDQIRNFMTGFMVNTLEQRIRLRKGGQSHFQRLIVATEEYPLFVDEFGNDAKYAFKRWAREARKFNMFMMVNTQSKRVKSMGIDGEGDLLENFMWVISLRSFARKEFPELVQGMGRPVVIEGKTIEPTPITIPYDERRDPEAEGKFIPFWTADGIGQNQQSLIVAPTPTPPPTGQGGQHLDAKKLTERDYETIFRKYQEMGVQSAVEEALFGYTGGAAYKAVKKAIDMFSGGSTTTGRFA